MKKMQNQEKITCGDCIHRWACAQWNVGDITNALADTCANFESDKGRWHSFKDEIKPNRGYILLLQARWWESLETFDTAYVDIDGNVHLNGTACKFEELNIAYSHWMQIPLEIPGSQENEQD